MNWRRVWFALALAYWMVAAATGQVFSIGSPKPALLDGETIALTPVLRDPGGNLMNVTDWVWTALDPAILRVDASGNATGVSLGVGRIRLTSASQALGLFGMLQLEVQPQSITVTPLQAAVPVGGKQSFSAIATDISGKPIPNQSFHWIVTGENGRSDLIPATTGVDSSGNFFSSDAGQYTVHAIVDYLPVVQGLPSHFEAAAVVNVFVPASFSIDRLVSSDPVTALKLQPAPGAFVASEAGPMAFTASTDGLSTAVIELNGSTTQSVIGTGSPSPQPGSVIGGFQSVAMNANGQMLIAIQRGDSANGALFAATAQGSQFVLLDNANGQMADGTPVNEMSYFYVTPFSLNDNGTAVIKALYLPQGQTAFRDGLFLLQNALSPNIIPVLLWSAEQGLPGVPVTGTPGRISFAFDDTEQVPGWAGVKGLGIDNNQTVYFMAQSGTARGVYSLTSGGTPQKIIAAGDAFLGSTVKAIQDLIVNANGDVTARVDLNNGDPHITLFRQGKYVSDLLTKGGNPRVLAESVAGVLFTGIPASGKPDGLYMWDFKTQTTVLNLSTSVTRISTATINSKGKVTAVVQSPSSSFVVTQPTTGTNLVVAGTGVNLAAPIDLKRVIKGSRTGLPTVAVSSPGSAFDLDGAGHVVPRATLGQSLGAGAVFEGADNFVEDGTGAQYFVTSGGLYKSVGGTFSLLVGANTKASDGVLITPVVALGANAAGVVLVDCSTNAPDGHRRLYKVQASTLTLIVRTKVAYGAHQIVTWTEAAVDGSGNTAVILSEDDGAQELALWIGTSTQSIATTRANAIFSGEQIAAIDTLRGAPSSFFVRYALSANFFHATVVNFSGSSVKATITTGDLLPDGTTLGDLRITDGNARGDVVFTSVAQNIGTQVLGVRLASGATRIVAANNHPLSTGDYLARFSDTNIRDDGTVYFLAFDINDRALAYRAAFIDGGPAISSGGTLNAADYRADTLAPGAWIAIYGQNFGRAATWTDINTTSLGGASVTICGAPAALSYNSGPIGAGASIVWQLNALVPDSVAGQSSCPIVVAVDGKVSAAATIAIKPAALGVFSFVSSSGNTLPLVTHLDYSPVGPASDGLRPTQAGEVVLAWGTGNCANPGVSVGGAASAVQFAGRVAPGVCQINFQVPAGLSGSNVLKFSTSATPYNLWVSN